MRKKLKLTIFLAFFSLVALGQKKEAWHNHKNYKEEIVNSLRKNYKADTTTLFLKSLDTNEKVNTQNKSFPNFKFVNGINIAWVNFGRDIGKEKNGTEYHPNLTTFSTIMDNVKNAGGNVVRWWYHTNGSTNPVFNPSNDLVAPNPNFFATDLIAILDLAASKGLKVQICLWSFDMLKGTQWNVNAARNKKILTDNTHLQAYLNNALIPLVNAVGTHPGLYAWEIFNEPEGMTLQYASNWPGFTDRVTITNIQWMINRTASAIRTAQPNVKITNGAVGFRSAIDNTTNGYINEYTDQKLIAAGGKTNGVLDFYNLHYYDWAGTVGSPFHNNNSQYSLDKPTVVAEYYPINTFGVTTGDLGTTLLNKGWHGSLVWSWSDKPWNDIKSVVQNLSTALQVSTQPVNQCVTIPIAQYEFTLTNSWSDQNNGSSLSNSNSALKIIHRKWGKNEISIISKKLVNVVAGKKYKISFDFKGDSQMNVSTIALGFANGFNSNGALLTQQSVNSTSGFSSVFKNHSAIITANSSGQINLAIKLLWNNQPGFPVEYLIKNIQICEISTAVKTSLLDKEFVALNNDIRLYPNPSNGNFIINTPIHSEFKIYDIQGRMIYENNDTLSTTTVNLEAQTKGIYFIQIISNGITHFQKIIIE
jgi:hypothetical protein